MRDRGAMSNLAKDRFAQILFYGLVLLTGGYWAFLVIRPFLAPPGVGGRVRDDVLSGARRARDPVRAGTRRVCHDADGGGADRGACGDAGVRARA